MTITINNHIIDLEIQFFKIKCKKLLVHLFFIKVLTAVLLQYHLSELSAIFTELQKKYDPFVGLSGV